VLYLAGGRFRIGTPREVINTETLSELYRSRVRVVEVDGQLLIVGGDEGAAHHHEPPADAAPEGRIL
jgi:zinc/manganese transport system ATP-binding protein